MLLLLLHTAGVTLPGVEMKKQSRTSQKGGEGHLGEGPHLSERAVWFPPVVFTQEQENRHHPVPDGAA